MAKRLLLILARVAASFGIAGASLYFFVVYPHQQALAEVQKIKLQAVATQRALDSGVEKLKVAPSPGNILPKTLGAAKGNILEIDSLIPIFNVEAVDEPKAVKAAWSEKKIDGYNALVANKEYTPVLLQGMAALKDGQEFLTYHRATLYAVANLLEYDPRAESAGKQSDELLLALEEAATGLEKALARLNEAPKLQGDSLQELIDNVKKVQEARGAYAQALASKGVAQAEQDAYVVAVENAQKAIVANRASFWANNQPKLLESLTKAAEDFRPKSAAMLNL